ncbi:MAG TPA: prolipoprotein diacylglyceryl transferase family protein, partial [Candidatus Limnocylindria bacterium]|nr:prolipoprotein diacylglyceryl transferase family protein [Candidatus Limnocylindria bacterium]
GFALLMKCGGACRRAGLGYVFLWYLVWYSLGRMVIEGIRTDSLMWGSLRVSQGLSAAAVAAAGVWMQDRLKLSPLLFVPLAAAAAGFVLSALGNGWALVPAYALAAAYAAGLAVSFRAAAARSRPS